MKTSEQILNIALEIENILKANDYPSPNQAVIKRLRLLANQLNPLDSYAAEKAFSIFVKAEEFYSARKHLKYPGGANLLYTEMTFCLLERIKNQAERHSLKGD